ncbi:TldD/PmbA family protein [candidate division WOR-3 bacterium]|uniref:TldD/PmbA family protein n=1 Tax=candidate division WOR-3 bacterium TaxID=2052148 RepID=A0A9D5QDJ8_UNCW3|nr:TldD/PmbA family protein [candidate division WOR-3 bacterium]MBD3364125.1 TldD/PmbA family protein [candidate division WOR-3 bacterium]
MRTVKPLLIGLLACINLWGTPSPILDAMDAELDRSMAELKLEGEESPYFISYQLVDRKEFSTKAVMGALMNSDDDHGRFLNVQVRVGDYEFDNMPLPEDLMSWDPDQNDHDNEYKKVPVPLSDDPAALRHALWLLTDMRYKWALKQYAKKEGERAREVEEERSPDFTMEEPVEYIGDEVDYSAEKAAWEEKVKDYSSLFKAYPEILDSRVSFSVEAKNDYFTSSEGTRIRQGKVYYWLRVSASTKAPDGMWVRSYRNFFGWREEDMPSDEMVKMEIDNLIDEVLALRDAPVMEAYVGPALIEPQAAGVFVHETYGHRLESQRIESKESGETFKDKVGTRIMPKFVSLYDDPTITQYRGMPVDGHYLYDDEGVPSRRTELIRKGILVNFICSRRPVKGFPSSNGHGRAQMEYVGYGDVPVSRQGNLILETTKPVPFKKLRKRLISLCRKQDRPYGLIFVRSEGGATMTGRGFMESFQSSPLLVYRVDAKTGKEELVRGVKFGGTPLVALDKIVATGDDPDVFNGYCGAESGMVPVGLVSPSLLLSEIEVAKEPAGKLKTPILSPPYQGEEETTSPEL